MIFNIFNIFSRRNKINENKAHRINEKFRNRLFILIRDSVNKTFRISPEELFSKLRERLLFLHGENSLSGNNDKLNDVLSFFFTCKDEHLLDIIELLFVPELNKGGFGDESLFVDSINEIFLVDNLPYYLTKSVWEEREACWHGSPATFNELRELPKIIRKDSDVLHNTAIEPVLALLRQKDLLNANEEFMLALDDFKRMEYKDCVSKCCSAFESVMKVICARKKIPFSQNDPAAKLLKGILNNSTLDSFWETPINLIATVRNKLSYAHGAGETTKVVTKHVAMYIINATAAAILLLLDEMD